MGQRVKAKKLKRFFKSMVFFTFLTVVSIVYFSFITWSISSFRIDMYYSDLEEKSYNIISFIEKTFIQKYSRVTADISSNNDVIAFLEQDDPKTFKDIKTLLDNVSILFDETLIYIMDLNGTVIANNHEAESLYGNNYAFRPYFRNALSGYDWIYLAKGVTTNKRGIYFSHPIYGDSSKPVGVTVVKVGTHELDDILTSSERITNLLVINGVVFSGNDPAYFFKYSEDMSENKARKIEASRQFGDEKLSPLPFSLNKNQIYFEGIDQWVIRTPFSIDGWELVLISEIIPQPTDSNIELFTLVFYILGIIFIGFIVLLYFYILQKRNTHEQMQYYANRDSLTNTLNRRIGLQLLNKKIKESRRKKNSLTICFVDADQLKFVNDNFGNAEGDRYLRTITEIIKNTVRKSDILSRYGGDEFLVIHPNCSIKDANLIWKRINDKLKLESKANKKEYTMSISCGLSEYSDNYNITATQFIKLADDKMFIEKSKKHSSFWLES